MTPAARPATTVMATSDAGDARRMNRCDSTLSASVACMYMPGVLPPNAVACTSARPFALVPMNTILSRKAAGSISVLTPSSTRCSSSSTLKKGYVA